MNYFIKIIKSLEDLNVLIDGITETVRHEMKKETRKRISSSFVGTFIYFISATIFSSVVKRRSGRQIRRAGKAYTYKNF